MTTLHSKSFVFAIRISETPAMLAQETNTELIMCPTPVALAADVAVVHPDRLEKQGEIFQKTRANRKTSLKSA